MARFVVIDWRHLKGKGSDGHEFFVINSARSRAIYDKWFAIIWQKICHIVTNKSWEGADITNSLSPYHKKFVIWFCHPGGKLSVIISQNDRHHHRKQIFILAQFIHHNINNKTSPGSQFDHHTIEKQQQLLLYILYYIAKTTSFVACIVSDPYLPSFVQLGLHPLVPTPKSANCSYTSRCKIDKAPNSFLPLCLFFCYLHQVCTAGSPPPR